MASIINTSTTLGGIATEGDSSNELKIQTDGTDAISIDGSQVVTFAAPIVFPAGTASTPAITTTGDTNTGIFFPGADRIGFAEGGAQCGEFDASGNFQFNSGFGSVATAYGCRAWVNFNGTANSNLSGTYTRTSPSTTVTVTATDHGLIVGSSVNLDFTTGTGLDGIYTVVTVADANTFTVTTVASTTTSGNVTLLRNTIRASGNVSSITDVGTGRYTVNFTTAMPDANYSIIGGQFNEIFRSLSQATTNALVGTEDQNGTAEDASTVHVAVFR